MNKGMLVDLTVTDAAHQAELLAHIAQVKALQQVGFTERLGSAVEDVADAVDAADKLVQSLQAKAAAGQAAVDAMRPVADIALQAVGHLLEVAGGLPFVKPLAAALKVLVDGVKEVRANKRDAAKLARQAQSMALLMQRALPLLVKKNPGCAGKSVDWACDKIPLWCAA